MLRKVDNNKMGRSDLGWLQSLFHFSFSNYYNPDNINFGVLRVVNDDLVKPNTGFGLHPHQDMEIISYVVDGALTHGDSMGNKQTITRGHAQYMSAGTGVTHTEYNYGDDTLRFLQIWIFPDENNLTPNYGDHRFEWDQRKNKWLRMVSGQNGDAAIKIHQDASINVVELEQGKEIDYQVADNRQAYLVQIEGSATINDISLSQRDALEIIEEDIVIKADQTSHILLIEMAKAEQ